MLHRIEGNGVRLVLVEDASRFARSVLAQEAGLAVAQRLGVRVVTASGGDMTATDDPGRIAMRQMAGVFAEFEKNSPWSTSGCLRIWTRFEDAP